MPQSSRLWIALTSGPIPSSSNSTRKTSRPTAVAGVPPDYFSADGQRWGNPLYDWSAHAADGYAWWLRRLRANFAMCDIVRIDHFRGFDSYWSIQPARLPRGSAVG